MKGSRTLEITRVPALVKRYVRKRIIPRDALNFTGKNDVKFHRNNVKH